MGHPQAETQQAFWPINCVRPEMGNMHPKTFKIQYSSQLITQQSNSNINQSINTFISGSETITTEKRTQSET